MSAKVSTCTFCEKKFGENDLGQLFVAYKVKRKRIFYHLNCVMWSKGVLRKRYTDKATYITSLYEVASKRECVVCKKTGPTLVDKSSGKMYYHYTCAVANKVVIDNEYRVEKLNFDKELAENQSLVNNAVNIVDVTQNDVVASQKDDTNSQKRKRNTDEITSSSSATLSEEEEGLDAVNIQESKKQKQINFEINDLPYPFNDSNMILEQQQQQQQVNNIHTDSLSPLSSPLHKNNSNISDDAVLYFFKENEDRPRQYPPPPPLPPLHHHHPSKLQQIEQQQEEQLTPLLSQIPVEIPTLSQYNTSSDRRLFPILPLKPSPIVSSMTSQQKQQIQTKEQQQQQQDLQTPTTITTEVNNNNNNNNNIISSKHLLKSEIIKRRSKNGKTGDEDIQSSSCTTSCITSSPYIIESSDVTPSKSSSSSLSLSDNSLSNPINVYGDFEIETDYESNNRSLITAYLPINNNSNNSVVYQLPPDSNSNSDVTPNNNNDNNNNNNNNNHTINYRRIFNLTSGDIIKFNMFIEARDMLEVNIMDKDKVICEGLFVCLYGPSSYMDALRSNAPMDIQLDRGIPEKDFNDIFNDVPTSQISIIRLLAKEYTSTCPLKLLLNKLTQNNLVGYLDYSDYELFIVPNGMNMMNCPIFHFIVDRYMRNGPVVPAWVLFVSKTNNSSTVAYTSF